MGFDGSGNFTRTYNFQNDRNNGIKILAARVDGEFDNFATGMNLVFFRDGRVPMSADLKMNGNRVTGIGDGSAAAPAVKFNSDANTGPYLAGVSQYAIAIANTQRLLITATGIAVTGNITATGTVSDSGGQLARLASPAFTGVPTAPTAAAGTNTTQLATTAFVNTAVATGGGAYAPLNSPAFTGVPTAPTAVGGTNTTQLATTAFVAAAVAGLNYAPLASPAFTGVPTAPTAAAATNSTQIATTAYVKAQAYATLASPALTGVPTAPTAANGTNTTQIASTAFVAAAIAGLNFAPLASPAFTGVPTAPTPASGTNTTQIATTAFVDPLRGVPYGRAIAGGNLIVADRGGVVQSTAAVTVPSATFNANDVVVVYNDSAAGITLTQGAGLTQRLAGSATTGNLTIAQRGFATIWFKSAAECVVTGNVS